MIAVRTQKKRPAATRLMRDATTPKAARANRTAATIRQIRTNKAGTFLNSCYVRWLGRTTGTHYNVCMDITERLWGHMVRADNGCLEWTRCTNTDGYGQIKVNGKVIKTHRLAWTLANGPIPDGLNVLHHCDNPPCGETEPSEEYPEGHLFLGTVAMNVADRVAKGRTRTGMGRHNAAKTHCPQRHEYTEANTYVNPTSGGRGCRACDLGRVHGVRVK